MSERIENLKRLIEQAYFCKARPSVSTPVRETFNGGVVWEGVIETFELDGNVNASSGLVVAEGNWIAGSGAGCVTAFERYRDGSVSQIKYPDGTLLHRDYTARGQLKSVSDNRAGWQSVINYNYLADGKVWYQDYGNGTRTNYDYNERGMMRALHHHRTSPYQNYAYRYYWRDERDRITAFQKLTDNSVNPMENGRGDRFRYDEEGQVVEAWYNAADPANSGAGNSRYDGFNYDALGNRRGANFLANRGPMDFTRKDNGLNQYRAWMPFSITNYDDDLSGWGGPGAANGVLMQDGTITAGFNALNQPTMINSAATGANWMFFGFDPLGRCVKRWTGALQSGGVPPPESNPATYFYYEGWNLIQEGPSASSASRTYVHGGRVDEILQSRNVTTGQVAYHHYDARGHATLLTNSSGGILEQYEYDAFGQPYFFNSTAQPLNSSTFGNRFLFTGREYLSDLKLYDYRNRMYQPELGRFLQPDPKHFAAGDYNLYRYCHNDPVNRNDPFGLIDREIDKKLDKLGTQASDNSLKAAKEAGDGVGRSQAIQEKDGKLSLGKITAGKTGDETIKKSVPGGFKSYHLQKESSVVEKGSNPAGVGHAHMDKTGRAESTFSDADRETARGSAGNPGIPVYKVNESNPSQILRLTPQVDYRDAPEIRIVPR